MLTKNLIKNNLTLLVFSRTKLFFLAFGFLFFASAFAQPITERGLNLPTFYNRRLHFGFSLGYNQTDFRIHTIPNSQLYEHLQDTVRYPNETLKLKSITSKADPGFNLGIIVDFKIHKYVRLRFLPGVSFASRTLFYTFDVVSANPVTSFTATRKTESAFILLPLNVKLQSKRIRNFGVYVISGATYSIDLASGKKDQANADVVRLKRSDYYFDAGGGVDFYFPYFKFGVELKMSTGLNNILIKDNTEFTTPINKLNSHVFLLSITFEG